MLVEAQHPHFGNVGGTAAIHLSDHGLCVVLATDSLDVTFDFHDVGPHLALHFNFKAFHG